MKYLDSISINGKQYKFFNVNRAIKESGQDPNSFPRSIKVLLENLLRNSQPVEAVKALLMWDKSHSYEIDFKPTQVLMQDFTGVPAIVDLAAMRDASKAAGKDPSIVNPEIKVDLVIDHSLQVDKYGNTLAFDQNISLEMERNKERYKFLKWAQMAFNNFRVVPPGTGICHQVNLEYLANVVSTRKSNGEEVAYIETVIGTDSHTTMINALSILGWGVGGIEAEAVMLGQAMAMLIPEVIGVRLNGKLKPGVTATDLVLTVTNMLRSYGVVQKFVEFCGNGLLSLSLADRATIANMSPEYGATCGFFPCDAKMLDYMTLTGRSRELIALVSAYTKEQGMFMDASSPDPKFTHMLELDLASVEPCLAGPKRPQDRVLLAKVPASIGANVSDTSVLGNGSVVIAAITSCTNTSNPSVMIAAGLVAKKACEKGLKVKKWVKTSLAPGSQVVSEYLKQSGLQPFLDKLGFNVIGYGCTTCIGNSGPLPVEVENAINTGGLSVAAVLSGNRNFEGRVHNKVKLNYLASPPLVVIYALLGSVAIDVISAPIGIDGSGKPVYLKDLWPTEAEIEAIASKFITRDVFIEKYSSVTEGTAEWKKLESEKSITYKWDQNSTYIRRAPYFDIDSRPKDILAARILLLLGDSITTDHISPAGSIASGSPAALYLEGKGVQQSDFNSYGARRGNHEVMVRGTFSNVRIRNQIVDKEGGLSKHFPDGKVMSVYDAAVAYQKENVPLVVVAGKEYGTGSSRDWAAKGVMLMGVKAVIAISFERIHRSNLVGMGILPLVFANEADRSKIKGDEKLTIKGVDKVSPGSSVSCLVEPQGSNAFTIPLKLAIYTEADMDYLHSGGILPYLLNQKIA